ncbi:hypothetical protein [Arthrobacter sp. CAN_C5]|nr:hypothetical protein [Arthrobacter sp. CAN_C5]MBP2216546.1 hypothetical protein [Arthrobacter sp. CAN_C5]
MTTIVSWGFLAAFAARLGSNRANDSLIPATTRWFNIGFTS